MAPLPRNPILASLPSPEPAPHHNPFQAVYAWLWVRQEAAYEARLRCSPAGSHTWQRAKAVEDALAEQLRDLCVHFDVSQP